MKRPAHPPAEKRPRPPRRPQIRLHLGSYSRKGKDYEALLVITPERLESLIQQAMGNIDGRAVLAGGGVAVLTKRITTPRPSAEASPRADGAPLAATPESSP